MIVIELSPHHYDRFVDRCSPSSREYAVLKNGVVVRRLKDDQLERFIEIHCDIEEARQLVAAASRIYPEAAAPIQHAIEAAESKA